MSFITYKKVNMGKTLAPIRIGAGAFGTVFFISNVIKTKTTSGKASAIFFLVICLIILIKGILKTLMYKDMYRIDSVLAKSEKDIVSFAELSLETYIGEKRLKRRIKKFIKKKYFHDCEIFGDTGEYLRINIQDEQIAEAELPMTCPDCGTQFTAKHGAVARCPECASIINM